MMFYRPFDQSMGLRIINEFLKTVQIVKLFIFIRLFHVTKLSNSIVLSLVIFFVADLDAQSMPKDEEYEKGCVKGNMVYKIHWTDPPTLMPVESVCGHIPQVSILDTKEVIYHTRLSIVLLFLDNLSTVVLVNYAELLEENHAKIGCVLQYKKLEKL